jgi:hypothetical protein
VEEATHREVHVASEDVGVIASKMLSLEVGCERTETELVVLQGAPAIRREGAGEDSNVAADRFERLVEDVCVVSIQ